MSDAGRLFWRCRRGTKELDVLLERYLRHGYPGASSTEKRAFDRILDLPDPVLADYLFGHALPAEPHLAQLVRSITMHRS